MKYKISKKALEDKVKSHLIFYIHKEKEKIVEIIRVLHQSMDVEERLNDFHV